MVSSLLSHILKPFSFPSSESAESLHIHVEELRELAEQQFDSQNKIVSTDTDSQRFSLAIYDPDGTDSHIYTSLLQQHPEIEVRYVNSRSESILQYHKSDVAYITGSAPDTPLHLLAAASMHTAIIIGQSTRTTHRPFHNHRNGHKNKTIPAHKTATEIQTDTIIQDMLTLSAALPCVSPESFTRHLLRLCHDKIARDRLTRWARDYYLESLPTNLQTHSL